MLININELKSKTHHEFDEDLHFSEEQISKIDLLKKIKSLKGHTVIELCKPYIIITLNIDGDLVLLSSRSLKDVDYHIKDSYQLTFNIDEDSNDDVDDNVIFVKGNEIDLDAYYYDLLLSNIPLKIIKEGEKENISGDSWELISEDEYYKRKKDEENPMFASLKNLDLDD